MNNEEKILSMLSDVFENIVFVKEDVNGMKQRMDNLETDVADIKLNVAATKQRVENMETNVAGIKLDVADIKRRVDNLETDVANVKIDVASVKRSVIIIENDHGKKLDVLFDGQQMNSEKLDRIEKEVMRHDDILVRNAL